MSFSIGKEGVLRKGAFFMDGSLQVNCVCIDLFCRANYLHTYNLASPDDRCVVKDLKMFPYKVQTVHQLLPVDRQIRLTYSHAVLNLVQEEDDFASKIIISDKTHFHLSGYMNKKKLHFWGPENPHEIHEQPLHLHPLKATVWCGICRERVFCPYFFEEADFELPISDRFELDKLPDFFLRGFLKSRVYHNKPQVLKANTEEEILNLGLDVQISTNSRNVYLTDINFTPSNKLSVKTKANFVHF